MKYIILFLISFSVNAGVLDIFKNTPTELVASKCRLKLPIKKDQCVKAGIHPSRVKGGQLEGLPVSAMKYGNTLVALENLPNKKEFLFLK